MPVLIGLMFSAWATVVSLYVYRRLKNSALMSAIPCIPGAYIPYIGHAVYLAGGQPWDTFYKWASGCGWTCRLLILGRDVLYTSEPKLIKRILQTNQRYYRKDLGMSYKEFMCILGRGLVTSEDQAWVRGRMLLSHAFRIDILDDIPDIATRATRRLMDSLQKQSSADATKAVDLAESFRCLTLQVIAEAVLSFTPEESDAVFPSLYLPIVSECNERVWAPWRKLMFWSAEFRQRARCLDKLNDFLSNVVRQRWQEIAAAKSKGVPTAKRDIFGTCLDHVKEFNEDTVLQLRDDLKTFLLAGHETSAAMLSWALYELCCRHPEYLDEIRREHENVFCSRKVTGGRTLPSVEQLQGLKWAPAVLREALRLYSVVPLVVRKADRNDVIHPEDSGLNEAFTVPKDTVVMIGMDGVHKRKDIWGADADVFKPSRFFDMSQIDPFAFIPFIAGPRNCIGQHLALLESSIVLSTLAYHFDFTLKTGVQQPLQRHHRIVPLAPAEGLEMTCSLRVPFE